jgi:quinol monooxygenase YgiN
MPTQDRCVTIVPYFKVKPGELDAFKALCVQFVAKSETEPKCLYYGFSFDGDHAFCREGYDGAAGALTHLDNVGLLLQEVFKIADMVRLEVHGMEEELEQLREPLAAFNPTYFTLEYGFRR